VRADLCARHRERHTAKGSHLQRKDAFLNSQRNSSATTSPPSNAALNSGAVDQVPPYPSSANSDGYPYVPDGVHTYSSTGEPAPISAASNIDPSISGYTAYPQAVPPQQSHAMPYYDNSYSTRQSHVNNYHPYQSNAVGQMHPPPQTTSPSGAPPYAQPYPPPSATTNGTYRSNTYSSMPALPPFGLPQGYAPPHNARSVSVISPPIVTSSVDQFQMSNSREASVVDFNFDPALTGYAMPVFGGDEAFWHRSPAANMDDQFFSYLLSTQAMENNDPSPPELPEMVNSPPPLQTNIPLPKLEADGTPSAKPAAPSTDLDITMRESQIKEDQRERLFRYVNRLGDIEHNPDRKSKSEILAGTFALHYNFHPHPSIACNVVLCPQVTSPRSC
jgi:hypothetical protein